MQVMVARCQCDPKCKRPPLPSQPFCSVHQISCLRTAPLSGYEPPYAPSRYNKTRRVKDSHNCFAYAFDYIDLPSETECNETTCATPFHQPGTKSGYPKWSKIKGKRCPDLFARLRADIPGIKMSSFTRKCPRGTSKIAVVVDPKEDYHFYRQDADGYWSHKPGGTRVRRTDAKGHLIYDPSLAARDYVEGSSHLNYSRFCGYMCAPRTKTLKFKRGGDRPEHLSTRDRIFSQ